MAEYRLNAQNKREVMTDIWRNLDDWLQGAKVLRIEVVPHHKKRTGRQNRRLWLIYQTLAENVRVDGRRFDAATWHEYCKGRFLGFEVYRLKDGSEHKIPISTTSLDTAEMTEYQNNIQAWAAGEFGIVWEV